MKILLIVLSCLISIGCKTLSDKQISMFGVQSFYSGCKFGEDTSVIDLENFSNKDRCKIGAKKYGKVVFDNVEKLREKLKKYK